MDCTKTRQTLYAAHVKMPLTVLIQRLLYESLPSKPPTARDLYLRLRRLGIGGKEQLNIADISNAVTLLVLEGNAVEVETERGKCYAWPLGKKSELFFSF